MGINLGEDHIMVEKLNLGIEHAKQGIVSRLLSASLVLGCLAMVAPASAKLIDDPAQPAASAPAQAANAKATYDAEQIKVLQQKVEGMQTQLSQMTSGLASRTSDSAGMPLHGFWDVGYTVNSQGSDVVANPNVANPKGFYQGSLSFYMAPHFGDRVLALAEPNFEIDKLEGSVSVDIERLQIGYAFSDAATLWGGRFHTPFGYWNTAFHHGAQIQTSILRPRFLDFEDLGGILPTHMVGLWGTGKVRAGQSKFTYDVFVGNGPKISEVNSAVLPVPVAPGDYQTGALDPNIAGDDNHSAMVGLNLGYDFSGMLDGLRLAVHWMNGDVNIYQNPPTTIASDLTTNYLATTNLNMGGGSLVYLSNDWEIMGEYYGFNNKDKATETKYKSKAGYMQIGVSFNAWTPYVRAERTILDQNDYYFSAQASGQSYAREVLGLRYNLNPKAALKFELMNSSFKEELGRTALSYRTLNIQYAIGF
jgi:hypothetical protein